MQTETIKFKSGITNIDWSGDHVCPQVSERQQLRGAAHSVSAPGTAKPGTGRVFRRRLLRGEGSEGRGRGLQ